MNQNFWRVRFDSIFFSKYFAIDKNRSSNSGLQLGNGVLGMGAYDYSISGWTIAALSVGATFLMLAIKKAQENNENQSFTN